MRIENSNSGVHVLVLARPADSVCAIWASALCRWRYAFSVYSTVYEVVNRIKDISAGQLLILVTRPAMLGPQVALFIEQYFPNLRIIGWVDSGDKVSDYVIAKMAAKGMVMASGPDHLQQIIRSFCKTIPQNQSVPAGIPSAFSEESDQLEYKLSDDEVAALLGVE